jgi:beta-phosphoglucomutase-like phosphatase (HAD superfamily)
MRGSDTPLDAVLFDMDGVVTDTAVAHAAAWKRLFDDYLQGRAERHDEAFQPFDIDRDYRTHVDGKPRYDGVKSFLSARGIELDFGSEGDPADAGTVCGLGNRKQGYFRDWLSNNKVPAFPGTLALIEALHREGIKTALFTSSRNADAVLENAGLADLFEVKVDGGDLAALDLPGKPDPAMLLEAASRLGAAPAHTGIDATGWSADLACADLYGAAPGAPGCRSPGLYSTYGLRA